MRRHRSSNRAKRAAMVVAIMVIGLGLGAWALLRGPRPTDLVVASDDRLPSAGATLASDQPSSAAVPSTPVTASPSSGRPSGAGRASLQSGRPAASGISAASAESPRRGTSPGQAPSTTKAPPRPDGASRCTKPVFQTSDTNGLWNTGGYFVHNNVWNAGEAGPETLYACSHSNWYVVSNQRNLASNPGSVKSYPNVHKDYNGERISSFSMITSSFAATTPHLGIYNVAYDLWLNGVASPGSTEVMIWTENYSQVPAGDKVATVTFGGVSYAAWKTPDSSYIAFVPAQAMTSGQLNLREMLNWLMSKGWLDSNSTLGQICFGIEIVSTQGADATFAVTDFSVIDR